MSRPILNSVFLLNAAICFFQGLSKSVYAPLLPHFKEQFAIGDARAGLLVTLAYFGYALARFPSGLLASHYGCTRTIVWGSMSTALSFIAIALAPGYFGLAMLTFVLGLASGVYVTAGYTLAVMIGSHNRVAQSTAAFELSAMFAIIASPLVVTFFVLNLNWRLLFVLAGCLLALVTLVFGSRRVNAASVETPARRMETAPLDDTASGLAASFRQLWSVSRPLFLQPELRRFLVWSVLVGGFGGICLTGVNTFIPTLLVTDKAYGYSTANQLFALVAVSAFLVKFPVGWLADQLGTGRVLMGSLVCMLATIVGLAFVQAHWVLLFLIVTWGATSYNSNMLMNSHVLKNMPAGLQAAGFGLFSTTYTAIYSTGPYLTGRLSELVGLSPAIALTGLAAVVAISLLSAERRFRPVDS